MYDTVEIINGEPITIWRYKVMSDKVRKAYETELVNLSLQLDDLQNIMNLLIKAKANWKQGGVNRLVKSIRLISKQITDFQVKIAEIEQLLKENNQAIEAEKIKS